MAASSLSYALVPLLLLATALQAQHAQDPHDTRRTRSVHEEQQRELEASPLPVTDDEQQAGRLRARGMLLPASGTERASRPRIAEDFIVFGYMQSEAQVFHQRWQALTHVGSLFVGFDASGSLTGTTVFTDRDPYLKQGGAADAAGVKLILVVNNFDDSPGGEIETVMTAPALRGVLVNEITSLLATDDYAHGVSLDLEFSWGATVRDGVTAFMAELREALNALDPALELSIYVNAIFSSNQWDFDAQAGITPSVDYVLYSMYDWATGLSPVAISDFDNCLGSTRMHGYLDTGLPPEKLVPVVSAYSRRWNGTSVYGGSASSSSSSGYTDALFDVTLNPTFGGPYAQAYVLGDEAGWYTWNDGTAHVRTWEAREGIEWKIRHALSMQDPGGTWNGSRLGGVAFWSLMWMAEFSSVDPRTGGSVSRTRTYPEIYLASQEVLSEPGQRAFLLEGFEGFDFRWRDPNLAPDTQGDLDGDCAWQLVASPPGVLGLGAESTNAAQVTLDVEGVGTNRVVFAHEILASPLAPTVPDVNASLGLLGKNARLSALVWTPAPLDGWSVTLLLVDRDGQLERGPLHSLKQSGWQRITWDLTAGADASGFPTVEPGFASGDGVLGTFGDGERDLAFYGFVFEGDGELADQVVIDELGYETVVPGGERWIVNELRYDGTDGEFIELHGPAGFLPTGLELRFYDPSDGTVLSSFPVNGMVPNGGGGTGFFVIGDPSVANVDSSAGFSALGDDLPGLDPTALQLIDTGQGAVHDSVVWEAYGGLDELIRRECRAVTDEGFPWLGEAASGIDTLGAGYVLARYPDGNDTDVNGCDFAFQTASPGAPNGRSLALPASIDFESAPMGLFQTYDAPRFLDPTSVGLPPSPSGGAAWRTVDEAGGGVIGCLGDAALGFDRGYVWKGELYVPSGAEPTVAIGIGLAGRQGSTFFTATAEDRTAYETGLWLIYENAAGVGLADGRSDHPGVWELVVASHDHADSFPTEFVASMSDLDLGIVPGTWTDFELELLPFLLSGDRLIVRLSGVELYRGDLPAGLDPSGALQVGFRENHAGLPTASEGVWVDGFVVTPKGPSKDRVVR